MNYHIKLPKTADTSWYDTATPEMAEEALKLGATLYGTLQSIKAGAAVEALEAKQAAELAAVRASADERIAAVQKELEGATAERSAAQQRSAAAFEAQRSEMAAAAATEKERLQAAHAARITALQSDITAKEERERALKERISVLTEARDADIRVAEDRTKALLQHALDEKERSVQRADAALTALKAAYDVQAEELRTLSDLIRKKPSASSSVKGKEFEGAFRERLIATFGLGERFALTDSARSGIGHAGDSLMTWGDHTILWEVKNYDYSVPTKEVEKFRRDMKENPQVRVGVMLSRSTPITGQNASGDRTIEFVEGKMLIYLSNFEAMSDDTLANLLMLFRVYWAHDHGDAGEEDASRAAAVHTVVKLHEEAVGAKKEWRVHKSHMENALRWMETRVEDTESRLRSALALLQGTAKAVAVPTELFRDAAGDTKMVADIQTVLRHATVDPAASCVLNDLADAFGKERIMSRETAKSHICAVLLDSVIDSPRGKAKRVLGLRLLPAPLDA